MEAACPWCGKKLEKTYKDQRFCSRACAAKGRNRDTTPISQRGKDIVYIRITKFIPVFDALRPRIGDEYEAERTSQEKGGWPFYIIRKIGKYGLVVRGEECTEINHK